MLEFVKRSASWMLLVVAAGMASSLSSSAQAKQESHAAKERLKFVLILSRHGVRSPTWSNARLDDYSVQPWPTWPVGPGLLTMHGKRLMMLLGAYDRLSFAEERLLSSNGCEDAAKVYVFADTDERTLESGRGLAEGLMPGCSVAVHMPDGDKLKSIFHSHFAVTPQEAQTALADLGGRIGGDPNALFGAYRLPLELMQRTLSTCTADPCRREVAKKLLEVPAALSSGTGDHLAEMKGPLNTGATFAENFQLEYLEGLSMSQVGWGQLTEDSLEELMALHASSSDLVQRTPSIATKQGGPLLQTIFRTLQQAEEQKDVAGAMGRSGDKVVILIGHDTNISNVAALLDAHWLIDGYQRDDAAPGGALFFELWEGEGKPDEIRLRYVVQSPAQMRQELALSLSAPPASAPIYIGGTDKGLSASWNVFKAAQQH